MNVINDAFYVQLWYGSYGMAMDMDYGAHDRLLNPQKLRPARRSKCALVGLAKETPTAASLQGT